MSDTNANPQDIRFDSKVGMTDRQLDRIQREMKRVGARVKAKHFWSLLTVFAIVAMLFALMIRGAQFNGQISDEATWIAAAALVGSAIVFARWLAGRLAGGTRATASKIESAFPTLGERLLTTADLKDKQSSAPLVQHLVGETHDHFRSHDWQTVVSAVSLWSSRFLGAVALAAAVSVSMTDLRENTKRPVLSAAELIRPKSNQEVVVVPGNVLIERGTSLVVTAEFNENAPESATLISEFVDGTIAEVAMKRNLSDPIVGGFLSRVDQPLKYRIESDQWNSELYSVDVFEFPELLRSDAILQFPRYTNMKSRIVEDTVKVSVVQGTEVTWRLLLNKTVDSCVLTRKKGDPVACTPVTTRDMEAETDENLEFVAYEATVTAEKSETFTLELIDDDQRENKFPPELSIKVLPNKPPKLKLDKARDVTVSALQELPLRAKVRDDYGVAKTGISYTIEDKEEVSVELGSEIARNVDSAVEYMMDFESLNAKPDDLVSFYFWAEDIGPDGKPRRTESDLYFADVRPFEEIFRQGDSPPPSGEPGQPSEQQQQAEEMAKTQKEIITAIWNQIRLEFSGETPKPDDIDVIRQSQMDVIEQFTELAGNLTDEKSKEISLSAFDAMKETVEHLEANDLPESRASAQKSFSYLLKLRSREFEITRQQRNQQQSQGGGGGQSRQQQIDDLELDEEQNRYETQQQAQQQSAQQQAAAEDRQVLSRLSELAKRTEDLIEELAKLQSALEQAENEEEEEEIRRQLKRLREQQQELLRMSDELESRMRSPENSERMSEDADKLQDSREDLLDATKATEENDASAALAAGRRAETQLDELQQEFRQRAAGAFDETIREMQRDATELQNEQKKIGESMREQVEKASPGLRGDEKTDAAPELLEAQAERYRELLEKMEQTVREADEAEPLLAEKLYDGFRQARRSQTEQQLENAAELVRRGFMPQAEQYEQEASKGIENLQQSIEDAAGAVLGDSTEGLRRAAQQLEQLTDGVEQELQRESQEQPGQQQPGQQQPGQQQPGQQQPGQQQPGQQQPGQQQPGQQQPGQQQPGQRQQPGLRSGPNQSDQTGQESAEGSLAAGSPNQGGGPIGPITGDFRAWSDQMRDVEEMVGDPELRARANAIRDRVRQMRSDMKRHGDPPQWELVKDLVAEPLRELKQEVRAELLRRTASKNQLVPIDRDPVPTEFTDAVRQYYENLGSADLESTGQELPK